MDVNYNTPDFMAKVLSSYGVDFTQPKVICPFHGDINPSMSIDLAKNRVYCFGCQKSYSAYQFIEASEPTFNSMQIYRRMAEIQRGVKLELKPQYIRTNSDSDFEQLRTQAKDYYYNLPKTNWLKEDGREIEYLVERGFNPKLLNACGAKINYNSFYPIIFPMIDNGVFKGWVCRTTNKEVEAKRKYLYNTGFRRATCLAGRYTAKSNTPLIIVEGYMDMLKLRQSGAKNVVAILGWKMSSEQLEKLRGSKITRIISALDNDEAGVEGHRYLKTLGFSQVERWPYPLKCKDPGDMTQKQLKKTLESFY